MSGKSRHGGGKHSPQAKKRESSRRLNLERQRSSAIAVQQQAIAQAYKPAPSAGVSTPVAKPTAVQYPYIAIELQRIGIIAGIMLAILVVLALILS